VDQQTPSPTRRPLPEPPSSTRAFAPAAATRHSEDRPLCNSLRDEQAFLSGRSRRSLRTTTRSAGGHSCFPAKEHSWRTAWRAYSLLSRTKSSSTRRVAARSARVLLRGRSGTLLTSAIAALREIAIFAAAEFGAPVKDLDAQSGAPRPARLHLDRCGQRTSEPVEALFGFDLAQPARDALLRSSPLLSQPTAPIAWTRPMYSPSRETVYASAVVPGTCPAGSMSSRLNGTAARILGDQPQREQTPPKRGRLGCLSL
jgi:hypothetical protein